MKNLWENRKFRVGLIILVIALGGVAYVLRNRIGTRLLAPEYLERSGTMSLSELMELDPDTRYPQGALAKLFQSIVAEDKEKFNQVTSGGARQDLKAWDRGSPGAGRLKMYSYVLRSRLADDRWYVRWEDWSQDTITANLETALLDAQGPRDVLNNKFFLAKVNDHWFIASARALL